MTFDGKAFGAEVVSAVKAHLSDALAPILQRIEALEQKVIGPVVEAAELDAVKRNVEALRDAVTNIPQPVSLPDIPAMISDAVAALPTPRDGKDVDPDTIRQMVSEAVAALPPAKDGKDVDVDEVKALVSAAVAALPVPRDGKDAEPEVIRQMVIEAVAAQPPAKDGKDVDMDQVKEMVETVLATWERPRDGKSVSVDDVAPMIAEAIERAVAAIPAPKDGCGVKELLIDRAGALVATMDDGRVKTLGVVVGRDGNDADMAALERSIAEKFAALPKPKDGTDGFSLEDFTAELQEDGRTISLSFVGKVLRKSVRMQFPVMLYRGVFREGTRYAKGDTVTWGGSLWHCDVDATVEKPDTPAKHWTLAAKRGRDARAEKVSP